jgi:hypothetical protein
VERWRWTGVLVECGLNRIVKRQLRITAITMSVFVFLIAGHSARAEPFEDFFDALKHAILHPDEKPRSHRNTRKQKTESPDVSSTQSSDGAVHTPPSEHNTRTATRARGAKDAKSGLRYGTPVPGKTGFVTSPFAPDSGYIDVRGFPPGTAVKDPYTDRIFLTP